MKQLLTNPKSLAPFLGALLSVAVSMAHAGPIKPASPSNNNTVTVTNNDYDLTHVDTYAIINNAIFTTPDNNTIVGTGVFDPFVRIQAENGNDSVQNGYNTDGRPVQFDTKDANQWSHSLLLSKVSTQVVNGITYREFFLDINESSGQGEQYLSLDDFRLFLGSVGNLVDYNFSTNTLAGATKVYDLDNDLNNATTNDPNVTIGLDYSNFSGSGNGIDLTVLVPNSVFTAAGNPQYVYLYSSFGSKGTVNNNQNCGGNGANATPCSTPASPVSPGVLPDGKYGASAGFEEWSSRGGFLAVPEPATYWLLGIGMLGLLGLRRLSLR